MFFAVYFCQTNQLNAHINIKCYSITKKVDVRNKCVMLIFYWYLTYFFTNFNLLYRIVLFYILTTLCFSWKKVLVQGFKNVSVPVLVLTISNSGSGYISTRLSVTVPGNRFVPDFLEVDFAEQINWTLISISIFIL